MKSMYVRQVNEDTLIVEANDQTEALDYLVSRGLSPIMIETIERATATKKGSYKIKYRKNKRTSKRSRYAERYETIYEATK